MEINLLVSEFNGMVARLRDSYATLDQKVVQRTSELKELNLILRELSITDGMTGLYNHRYFYEQLQEEIKKAERYKRSIALVMIDVDHFKAYNDTNGHPAGDDVLKSVASCIRDNVRELDLVARYGGEEFSVIAPETSAGEAVILAERIRLVVSEWPFPDEKTQPGGNLTVSLGVASLPENAKDAEGLIKSADEALYRAKQSGRNRVESAWPIGPAADGLDADMPAGTPLH